MPEKDPDLGTQNEELIRRIRERYRYGMDKWRRNREEGQKNMRYVSGDPWDDKERNARQGRPTVCADQLNQYVNQVINTARQNPRGVIIDPAGDGATEQLAEYRENRIRAIEYGCNATQAYINGLQGAVERNVGYWKVSRVYASNETDEQEIVLLPILNPDSVVIDPDYKELDGSDIKWAFELDKLTLEEFQREYPEAQKTSFAADDFGGDAIDWFDGKHIVVASYSEINTESREVGKRGRKSEVKSIQQYITNGCEILKKADPQPGPYIPIVPCFGKELWVEYGSGGAERVLLSLVSLARDPQKALAYVMSAMLENVGQLPKTSFIGAVGQFETDEEAWNTANTQFHPFLQYDSVTDQSGSPLPPPQRTPMTPDFQAYATGVDICQRAIQSAMGLQALPSAAQRSNQKSGVALEKIQSEQSIGSYHLVDNYDRAIKLTGRIINNWLSLIDLGEIEKPIREADGTHKMVHINTDEPVEVGEHTYHFPIADDKGRYQITISSGPSHESQREEATEFASDLMQNLKNLPLAPQQAQQVLGLVVKLKQLGPLGDQISEIISPRNGQQGQQLAQIQQQMMAMQQQSQEMQALIQKLMLERQGKVIEGQFKLAEADKDRETKIAVAEIQTKAQVESERQEFVSDMQAQFHDQAHDVAMQATQQQHEQSLAQQQQAAPAQQIAQQQQEPAGPAQGQ